MRAVAISGTSVPPIPMPRYAKPIALPRFLSNQRASNTWFGSGPPQTLPRAFSM
jgi:hypothetical protein